jgi:hypothetical protein
VRTGAHHVPYSSIINCRDSTPEAEIKFALVPKHQALRANRGRGNKELPILLLTLLYE